MTDKTQPEALRLADALEYCDASVARQAINELRRQHARIAELEAEIAAVGAGGVQALSAAPAIGDELRDTLVAVSAAIAEQDDRTAQKMIREILAASPTPPAEQPPRWVERWHGSGGKEFWEGWSILNATNREMIAHLGPDVGPDAVRDIVAAHNASLCGECAGTGGRWCPACAGATPPAEQQAAPKAAPQQEAQKPALFVSAKQLADLVDPSHATGGSYLPARKTRAGLFTQPLYTAPQQEAQEPSHRETVDVVGVRSNGEHVNLEKIAMPPRMKAREIAIEQFGSFKDDDGSDAEMCFGALEYFLEWLIQQGWSKAPQQEPAPLSDEVLKEVIKDSNRYRWLRRPLLNAGQGSIQVVMDDRLNGKIDRVIFLDELDKAIDAALAAQGGE